MNKLIAGGLGSILSVASLYAARKGHFGHNTLVLKNEMGLHPEIKDMQIAKKMFIDIERNKHTFYEVSYKEVSFHKIKDYDENNSYELLRNTVKQTFIRPVEIQHTYFMKFVDCSGTTYLPKLAILCIDDDRWLFKN